MIVDTQAGCFVGISSPTNGFVTKESTIRGLGSGDNDSENPQFARVEARLNDKTVLAGRIYTGMNEDGTATIPPTVELFDSSVISNLSVVPVSKGRNKGAFLQVSVDVKLDPGLNFLKLSIRYDDGCLAESSVGGFYKEENSKSKSLGQPDFNNCSNPINGANGNKYQLERDYADFSSPLRFARYYNSGKLSNIGPIGRYWRTSDDSRLVFNSNEIYLVSEDGKLLSFSNIGGAWNPDGDVNLSLTQVSQSGLQYWELLYPDGHKELFNNSGKLLKLIQRNGRYLEYIYDAQGNKVKTLDSHTGKSITMVYENNLLAKLVDSAGGVYKFGYLNSRLTSVEYPYAVNPERKEYIYGELEHTSGVVFADALTGIVDENGSRFATYKYDNLGLAYSSEHALGQHRYLFEYLSDTQTIITSPNGATRNYTFQDVQNVKRVTNVSQPEGSGCSASSSSMTYDVNGNVSSRSDFNGNKTTYVYDLSRNIETSRTEGLTVAGAATTATRTITTAWHPTWRLPTEVAEYSGASASGTPLKRTTTTYDDKGNITSVTEADPIKGLSRTTTMTYTYSSAVAGLVLSKVVDGPRTDINDITTYQYYPHDASCADSTATPIIDPITGTSPANLGCRGQLQSMTNALGQTTTYDRYNHHGQIEQMTDANGLVTSYTYDLRQRMLSKTVGTEVTNLSYDGVGQVTQLTLPDGSQLNYSYDAAHRLTDVQDNLGNKVHYTLDTEGNRTKEDITDPQGNLTKTLSRSYDALNRLQTLTGL